MPKAAPYTQEALGAKSDAENLHNFAQPKMTRTQQVPVGLLPH